MLGRVNVERSECSRAADRESIHAGIRDSVGFGALGRMVFGVMEEWMVEELRAEVAARQRDGDERGEMRWSCVMGSVLKDQGRREEAVEFEERALEISQRVLSEDDAGRGVHMNNLAGTYFALGRHEDALAMEESALEFRRRVLPPGHPDIAMSLYNIGVSYEQAGDMRKAMDCAREAVVIWQASLPPGHPHLNLAEKNVLRLERKNKRPRGDGARTHGVPPTSSRRRRSPASSPLSRQAQLYSKTQGKQVAHVLPPAALARN
jgi:tetratricopeptide (TPR) repeat protein